MCCMHVCRAFVLKLTAHLCCYVQCATIARQLFGQAAVQILLQWERQRQAAPPLQHFWSCRPMQ